MPSIPLKSFSFTVAISLILFLIMIEAISISYTLFLFGDNDFTRYLKIKRLSVSGKSILVFAIISSR
jgi:hypothetical protein